MKHKKYTVQCLDASYTAAPLSFPAATMEAMKVAGTYKDYMENNSQETKQEAITNTLALLHQLSPVLQSVLDAELKAGNKVAEAGSNYPDQGSIFVTLANRFKHKYKTDDLLYSLSNDPHYWYADYCTLDAPRHLLVCG